jgi:radical SAM superfamily enzyme with C-terminal helix-hairpin-helix motif
MARNRTILDCYTDEPAGLGVPPFLGVWPRYAAGQYRDEPQYLTIDDLRLAGAAHGLKAVNIDPAGGRTRIDLLNHTRQAEEVLRILRGTDQLTIVMGVQTPGKYLSAQPGTLAEVQKLLRSYKFHRILTGPIVIGGSQFRGGAKAEVATEEDFDEVRALSFDSYDQLQPYAVKGCGIIRQIPQARIVEIETGRGCTRPVGCSFCTEPVKNTLQWRRAEDIVEEVRACMRLGVGAFRLGKQCCIFSYEAGDAAKIERLLSGLAELKPDVLHVDNANPAMVTEERVKLFVKYLTAGSTAAMGVESFDRKVAELNNLNCTKEMAFEAVRTINRFGSERGENGCPAFLPGINILLGLDGESKETLDKNLAALKQLLDDGLLVRRINIRQVVPFPGTRLYEVTGDKFLRKNRRYYGAWIDKVRHEIDLPMLRRVFPKGTILRRLRSEAHHGEVTFLRQMGSYPIIVGVHERLPLSEFFEVRITDHMLRSLTGEVLR